MHPRNWTKYVSVMTGSWSPEGEKGSCTSSPFWSRKLDRNEFLACQALERGELLGIRAASDHVYLDGRAITALRGEVLDYGQIECYE